MALYTVPFSAVAVTAQQDLFEILTATDSVTIIHAIELGQYTEFGDAQDEDLSILVKTGQTTTGTGGTTVVPPPVETGSSLFGGTCKCNNTTKASAGTIVLRRADSWAVRSPYIWLPTPEMRFILGPSVRLTVELASTPADSITMNGTLTFEELGG